MSVLPDGIATPAQRIFLTKPMVICAGAERDCNPVRLRELEIESTAGVDDKSQPPARRRRQAPFPPKVRSEERRVGKECKTRSATCREREQVQRLEGAASE